MKKAGFIVDYMKVIKLNFKINSMITGLILPLTLTVYIIEKNPLKVFLYIYSSLYFTISVGTVSGSIAGAYFRLKSITEILNLKFMHKSSGKYSTSTIRGVLNGDFDSADVIRALTEAYYKSIDICDEINVVFCIHMMLGFGIIFFNSLFTGFTAYKDIATGGSLSGSSVPSIVFGVYYNIVLSAIIFSCTILESEVTTK